MEDLVSITVYTGFASLAINVDFTSSTLSDCSSFSTASD